MVRKMKKEKYISLFLFMLLLCGCARTDNTMGTEEQKDIGIETQQSDISQEEALELPKTIAELADSQLDREDLDKIETYDTGVLQYQIFDRMQSLGLAAKDFMQPVESCASLYQELYKANIDLTDKEVVTYTEDTGEALQEAIDKNAGKVIFITSDRIKINRTMQLRDNTYLVAEGCSFEADVDGDLIAGENISDVVLSGIEIEGRAQNALRIDACQNVVLTDCHVRGMKQRGLRIQGTSQNIIVANCSFTENEAGGATVVDDAKRILFYRNDCSNNYGCINDNAGFSFGNCYDTEHFPSEVIVYQNTSSNNQSGGMYCSGLYKSYFINNTVTGNQKEGTCLDWQTFGCYLLKNTYQGNGWRADQPDEILEADEVLQDGRMEDGSSKAKLPGISLDNAVYNILEQNTVTQNGGSGIKMVRASVGNLISDNSVADNNTGENERYHFFGIELGGERYTEEKWNMDFGSDYGNIVSDNRISGAHYAALFLAEGAEDNVIYGNISAGETHWMIESIAMGKNALDTNAGEKPSRIL